VKLRRTIATALAGAAVATTLVVPVASASTTTTIPYSAVDGQTGSVLNVLEADGTRLDPSWNTNWYDFDILERVARIVVEAKPGTAVAGLASAATSWTVFAPNDRAFQVLAYELTGRWYWTEGRVINAIVTAVGAAFGTENTIGTIENVLLYHVHTARKTYSQVKALSGSDLSTALNAPIGVKYVSWLNRVVLRDADTTDRNPWITSKRNIEARATKDGSIIHGISLVLRPVELP
jgi:uncharacterized surface protein with fasciclin (FAS1) repeats